MIGDVVGRGGRKTLSTLLPKLVEEQNIDFVIAQGENSAGGFGLTKKTSKEFFDCGVDVITSGNHIWDKLDIFDELESLNSKILFSLAIEMILLLSKQKSFFKNTN